MDRKLAWLGTKLVTLTAISGFMLGYPTAKACHLEPGDSSPSCQEVCCPPNFGAGAGGGGGGGGGGGPTSPGGGPGSDGGGPTGLGPKGSERESDPVNFATGDFTTTVTDLFIPGRGYDFEFKRTYRGTSSLWHEGQFMAYMPNTMGDNSLLSGESPPPELSSITPFGAGWSHSYFSLIRSRIDPANDPTHITMVMNDQQWMIESNDAINDIGGFPTKWSRDEMDGVLTFNAGTVNPDDEFVYTTSSGFSYIYERFTMKDYLPASGQIAHWFRLKEIRDRNYDSGATDPVADNNVTQITYKDGTPSDPDSFRIDQITDTLGNVIEFTYTNYNLTKIKDLTTGREVEYTYQSSLMCLPCIDQNYPPGFGGGGTAYSPPTYSENFINPTDELTEIEESPFVDPIGRAFVLRTVKLPEVDYGVATGVYSGLSAVSGGHTDYDATSNRRQWVYSYTGAIEDDDCAFVLLETITDPSGTVILTNEWSAVGEYLPFDDRSVVTKQTTPSGEYSYSYPVDSPTGNQHGLESNGDFIVKINNKQNQVIHLRYAEAPDYGSSGVERRRSDPASTNVGCLTRQANQLVSRKEFSNFGSSGNPFEPDATGLDTYESTYGYEEPDGGSSTRPNPDWRMTEFNPPESDESVEIEYGYNRLTSDSPAGLATDEEERSFKKMAMTKRTRTGTNPVTGDIEIVKEEWRYGESISGCCSGTLQPTMYHEGHFTVDGTVVDQGNKTFYDYDDTTGNLLEVWRGIPGSLDPTTMTTSQLDSNSLARESFLYNPQGQLVFHQHAARETTGGSQRQIDAYVYGTGSELGRLVEFIADIGGTSMPSPTTPYVWGSGSGLELKTEYEYDEIGNLTKIIGPGLDYKSIVWNQANQIVLESWYNSTAVLLARREHFYDINGNPVRTDVENFVASLGDLDNNEISTLMQYDEENNLLLVAQELDEGPSATGPTIPGALSSTAGAVDVASIETSLYWAVTEYVLDNNKNVVAVEYPMANAEIMAGTPLQADNGIVMQYDARGLLIRQYKGTTNVASPTTLTESAYAPLPLVTEVTYDDNGRPVSSTIDPGSNQRVTTQQYDGFGRIVRMTDPMGNQSVSTYDGSGNLIASESLGELVDLGGSTSNVTLSYMEVAYDDMNRSTDRRIAIFDPATYGGTPSVWQWSKTEYNADSSVRTSVYPSGDSPNGSFSDTAGTGESHTEYLYDSAGRLASVEDQYSNFTEYTYDSDSNVVAMEVTEQPGIGSMTQVYKTTFKYDGLDRQRQVCEGDYGASGPKNTTKFAYDSRSQMIKVTDPRLTITEYSYDGLGRRRNTVIDPTGLNISTSVLYDQSSRVTELTDDNGHATSYTYDSLGREISRTYADGSEHTTSYNSRGDVYETTDGRLITMRRTYDTNGRLTRRFRTSAIPVGPNVGATDETYEYDGLNRVVTAENDFSIVERKYDSRGLMLTESLNADYGGFTPFPSSSFRTVENTYNIAGVMTVCKYPSGRQIYRKHDNLNRVIEISNGSGFSGSDEIATYNYYGSGRVQQRTTGPNGAIETDYTYTGFSGAPDITGDSGYRNIVEIEHRDGGMTLIEGRSFTWDAAGNKLSHHDLRDRFDPPEVDERRERDFTYDLANRLLTSETTFPDSGTTANDGKIKYHLDGVHNRTEVEQISGVAQNGAPIGDYISISKNDDPDVDVYHSDLNQYTVVPRLDGGSLDFEMGYDSNGNLSLVVEYPRAHDLNGNYETDMGDASIFADAISTGNTAVGDYDGDGDVDLDDQAIFVTSYNNAPAAYYNASIYYDYRNQLTSFDDFDGANEIKAADYHYDCFNRRIIAEIDSDGDGTVDESSYFVYAGQANWQLVEEYPSEEPNWNNPTTMDYDLDVVFSYAYGNYIDEVLTIRDEISSGNDDYYYSQDDLFSVYAITDDTGSVVERYEYGDYGETTIKDGNGSTLGGSSYKNKIMFAGQQVNTEMSLDDNSSLYYMRSRTSIAGPGRFMQRDGVSYLDSMNLYQYAISSPLVFVDPLGMQVVAPLIAPRPVFTPRLVYPPPRPFPTPPGSYPGEVPLPFPGTSSPDLFVPPPGPSPMTKPYPETMPKPNPQPFDESPYYEPNCEKGKNPCGRFVRDYKRLERVLASRPPGSASSCAQAQSFYQAARALCHRRMQADKCHGFHGISDGKHGQATTDACKAVKKYYKRMRKLCNKEYEDWEDDLEKWIDSQERLHPRKVIWAGEY